MSVNERKIWSKFKKYYLTKNSFFEKFIKIEINSDGMFSDNNQGYDTNYVKDKSKTNKLIVNMLFKSFYRYIYQIEDHEQKRPQNSFKNNKNEIISDVKRAYRQDIKLKFLLDNFGNYDNLDDKDKASFNDELKMMTGSIGEHLIFNLLLENHKAVPIFLRVNLKSSPNIEVNDVDALHYNIDNKEFFIGESKIILPTSETVNLSDVVRDAIKDTIKKLSPDMTIPLIKGSSLFINNKVLALNLSRVYEELQTNGDKFIENGNIVLLVGLSKKTCCDKEYKVYRRTNKDN